MSHDAFADGDGGDGGQLGAVAVATRWGDGKLGALPSPTRHLRLWEADHRRWVCASDMTGGQWNGGCDGSFHPGALAAKGVTQILG